MFLRKNRKKSNGEVYEYWTLCETVRTELGPRQRVVATLGRRSGRDRQFYVGGTLAMGTAWLSAMGTGSSLGSLLKPF